MPKRNYSDEIRDVTNKMEALINTASGEKRDLTDEEQEVFSGYEKEVENLTAASEREKRLENIRSKLDTPVTNTVKKTDPADDTTVTVGNTRDPIWKSPGEFLNAVQKAYMPSPTVDNRLLVGNARNATGMSVSVASDGGFMVGADNEKWLMEAVKEQSQIFSKIDIIPVGADKNGTSLPGLDETSRADGSRSGGALAYWVSEAATATASKPKLRNLDLKLEKLLAFCYMTDELLADARAMQAFVKKVYGAEMAFKLDDAIINGDGNGKPLGILNSPALVTQDAETGQTAATIVAENIIKMWSRLSAKNKSKSAWYINQEIEPELATMAITVGTGGVPVYMPAGGLAGLPYSTLFGRPVIACEQCAALGTEGDIILADMSDYVGIDKDKLQADSSIHVQFLYDEMAFRFRYRFNGAPYTHSELTPYKGSATTSPYVALETRS